MAYFNPKIEIKRIVNAALDEALPAWEARYEPGNVSDYLIGYANTEAAAKGAALAWLQSQSDANPTTLEWVEQPTGDQHDHWYGLIQNADGGMALDLGINVRHRLPATVRNAAPQNPNAHRPPCIDGDHCGESAHCPPITTAPSLDSALPLPDIQFGRPFVLVRDVDVSGVSGTGIVANGIEFPDGHAAIHWTGSRWPTTTPHSCMESVTDIHSHEGATRVVWEPTAIPQAEYSSVWPELIGWVQAAQEDGEQITPEELLAYLSELKRRAMEPVRRWMEEQRRA
ncbi:hypothetical protein HHL19_16295 [Streptomyces sp. R302]|uniref:hypothetical protein n=1 Tax=unclassified Streptomyces TaxID=2593676 RepID=UPI00145D566E|nr:MULTISPECIES: hypothetical protein [unclassified Streptomyces]NML55331.1 hypothetical protein [Streptomyces sp. R301]NML80203.1 hypothetical protein [Streptomyces sp. R302]